MAEQVRASAEIIEDWNSILMRPGMNVLATQLTANLNHLRAQLETDAVDSMEKISLIRGEMRGTRKIMQFIKSEYDRAAKGHTPEKER